MKQTPAQKIRFLQSRCQQLQRDVESLTRQLAAEKRAHETLSYRFNGFYEALHLLAPRLPELKEEDKS